MNVVEYYRHPVTGCLGQPNISRDYGFEDLAAEEASKVGSNLLGESRSVIVHGEQYALDCERGINRTTQTHERVKEFRDALKSEVFALDRYEDGIARSQCIER
jgi:hypothetical protein